MISRPGTAFVAGPLLLSLALFFPAGSDRSSDLKMSGVWDYNVDESVDAFTGLPEEKRSTRDEPTTDPLAPVNPPQGVNSGNGGAGGGPPLPPMTPYGRIVGAANAIMARAAANGPAAMSPIVIDPSKILLRDLLEIPRQLAVTVRTDGVTFVDDLDRARTYLADRKKHRYQLGAATFNATAFWDADQFRKEIKSPAQGFKMTETYAVSEDGSRLFVIIRLGDQQAHEPVSGVNRVYDRVESRGSHVRVVGASADLTVRATTAPPADLKVRPTSDRTAADQTPPTSGPVFRAGARVVPVYATVANAAGSFILNVQKEEFVVKDDGKVQPIVQFTTDEQALSIVLLIDGSSSMLPSFTTVIDGVNAFVVRLRPADRTRVASFANDMRFGPMFTSDRDALLAFLKNGMNLRMGNQTKLWDSLMDSIIALKDTPGRRVVVVFSDGDDRGSHTLPHDVEMMAANLDVMIYALATWTWDPVDKRMVAPVNALKILAAHTGGGYYELRETQDMNTTFTRVADELHRVYLLGFVPQTLDDKTHKLQVQVSRPGLTVRARTTYLATAR